MPSIDHNRAAWNKLSGPSCPWSVPVTADEIAQARRGHLAITVAGRVVPEAWLGDLADNRVLCLAGGGGQQGPLLAAAGSKVTVMDIAEAQLELDERVCAENGLTVTLEQGTMTDLSRFAADSFDLIVNPVSNCYVPDVRRVWKECFRVINTQGRLIAGSINPVNFMFEENDGSDARGLTVKFPLPYVESETLTSQELEAAIARDMPFTWSHSLDDLLQGQIDAGFSLQGLLESRRTDPRAPALNQYAPTYLTTLAIKASSPSGTSESLDARP